MGSYALLFHVSQCRERLQWREWDMRRSANPLFDCSEVWNGSRTNRREDGMPTNNSDTGESDAQRTHSPQTKHNIQIISFQVVLLSSYSKILPKSIKKPHEALHRTGNFQKYQLFKVVNLLRLLDCLLFSICCQKSVRNDELSSDNRYRPSYFFDYVQHDTASARWGRKRKNVMPHMEGISVVTTKPQFYCSVGLCLVCLLVLLPS